MLLSRSIAFLAATLVVASLAACSSSSGDTTTVACDLPSLHECIEVTGSSSTTSTADSGCTRSGGMKVEACTTSNLLGSCSLASGSASSTTFFYANGGTSAASERSLCESTQTPAGKGVWRPGS